jgi:hypothetical protein
MPLLTLNKAAKAASKSKSTLLDAINSKRLRAFKNKLNQWQIDPDDLFMAYPKTEREPTEKLELETNQPNRETTILRQKLESLERIIESIKDDERDYLRHRLNDESGELRNLSALINKIYNDRNQLEESNANREKDKPSYIQTEAIIKILNQYVTTSEIEISRKLEMGKDLIIQNYFFPNPAVLYDRSNTEIIKDLTRIGVLHYGQVSERFKLVTNNILQNRDIKEITNIDFHYIAIRYIEWGTLELPR